MITNIFLKAPGPLYTDTEDVIGSKYELIIISIINMHWIIRI